MSTYQFNKTNNLEKLAAEIKAQGLPYQSISALASDITVEMSRALTEAEEAILNTVIANHSSAPTISQIAAAKIDAAMVFGTQMIRDFAAENVALGITQFGLTSHVRRTLVDVAACLTTGSLYDAITELKAVDPAKLDAVIMTPARLLVFRNKIEDFLQITRSTTWNQ